MKLTTIALASALAVTSSMALAQGLGGGTAAHDVGASPEAVGGAGSMGTETTGMSYGAAPGSSNGLSSGFSTGTYPTLVTPGGLPSSVPAPGAVIRR